MALGYEEDVLKRVLKFFLLIWIVSITLYPDNSLASEFDEESFASKNAQEMYEANFNLGSFQTASTWAKKDSPAYFRAINKVPEEMKIEEERKKRNSEIKNRSENLMKKHFFGFFSFEVSEFKRVFLRGSNRLILFEILTKDDEDPDSFALRKKILSSLNENCGKQELVTSLKRNARMAGPELEIFKISCRPFIKFFHLLSFGIFNQENPFCLTSFDESKEVFVLCQHLLINYLRSFFQIDIIEPQVNYVFDLLLKNFRENFKQEYYGEFFELLEMQFHFQNQIGDFFADYY